MEKNLIANVLGCLILLTLINGCSSVKPIQISAKPVEKPELILPDSDNLNLRPVSWFIINEKNFDEQIEKIKEDGKPLVMFAVTGDGYQNLIQNLSDIRAYIQQQQIIIYAFNAYYLKSQDLLEEANDNIDEIKIQAEEINNPPKEKSFWKKLFSK